MGNENFNEILSKGLKEFDQNKRRNELEVALYTVSEFLLLLFDYLSEEQEDE